MLKLILFLSIVVKMEAIASAHQVIDTLGISPKGQYVALEEYGYKQDKHSYYVIIKVMNVWKKQYVGIPVRVELPANRPHSLFKAREKAKILAQEKLERFNISG